MSFKKNSTIVKVSAAILSLAFCFSATVIEPYAADSTKGRDIWIVDGKEMEHLPADLENELSKDPIVRDQLALNGNTSNPATDMISVDGTDISNVLISGVNLGIVIEKSLTSNFEMDHTAISDTNGFSFDYTVNPDGTFVITISSDSLANFISADPENKINAVSIKIPEKLYNSFAINIQKGGLYLPNIEGNVIVESEKSSVQVTADRFKSSFNLSLRKSSLKFNVTEMDNNVNIVGNDAGNSVNVTFNEPPKNLTLDATKCKGSVILPDGWNADYRIGSNKPIINLNIKGSVEIAVKQS